MVWPAGGRVFVTVVSRKTTGETETGQETQQSQDTHTHTKESAHIQAVHRMDFDMAEFDFDMADPVNTLGGHGGLAGLDTLDTMHTPIKASDNAISADRDIGTHGNINGDAVTDMDIGMDMDSINSDMLHVHNSQLDARAHSTGFNNNEHLNNMHHEFLLDTPQQSIDGIDIHKDNNNNNDNNNSNNTDNNNNNNNNNSINNSNGENDENDNGHSQPFDISSMQQHHFQSINDLQYNSNSHMSPQHPQHDDNSPLEQISQLQLQQQQAHFYQQSHYQRQSEDFELELDNNDENQNNNNINNVNHFNTMQRSNSSTNTTMNNNQPTSPHKRTRASGEILQYLIEQFTINSSPSSIQRKEIAERTGMPERSVRIWFQNRRAKARKQGKLEKKDDSTNSQSSNTQNPNTNSNSNSNSNLNSSANPSFSLPFQQHSIEVNNKYYIMECKNLSIGNWQRIKSGYITNTFLPNLSPQSIMQLMSTTDLVVILSKKDAELNYFFSGVFQNEKVLFRIFYPVRNILKCSLLNQTDYKNTNLNLELSHSPQFAVHFTIDPATGEQNVNQWSICDDFSEGQQVTNAHFSLNGLKIPHILHDDLTNLKFLHTLITSIIKSLPTESFTPIINSPMKLDTNLDLFNNGGANVSIGGSIGGNSIDGAANSLNDSNNTGNNTGDPNDLEFVLMSDLMPNNLLINDKDFLLDEF